MRHRPAMPADTGSPLDIPSSKGMNAPYGSANHHKPFKQHIETAPSNKGTGEGATGSGSTSSSRRTVIHSVLLFCISVGTLYAFYDIGRSSNPVAVLVWWYGWITAASTGLGVLPFLCRSGNLNRTFIGFANALAAAMMISATAGLLREAVFEHPEAAPSLFGDPAWSTGLGVIIGCIFVKVAKSFLEKHEDIKFSGLEGLSARKMILMITVMTVHSVAEGIAIGVSFAHTHRPSLGVYVSTTLAIHNIPEGLATCLVLIPQGVSRPTAALWSIFTSFPQPVAAVLSFMGAQLAVELLPVGLGFAGGAMAFVAFSELIPEAQEDLGGPKTWSITTVLAILFTMLQFALSD